MTSETDKIEKRMVLRASRSRVWRAISDSQEFGAWFGVKFDGPFVPGEAIRGRMVGTSVDPEVAKKQAKHSDLFFDITIEDMEAENRFSFRWHPYAVEKGVDYSHEPTTLIVFELHDDAEGTVLIVTESGFDSIPLERRALAFSANSHGWELCLQLVEKYLVQTS
jgi:uncharacterized protein YndB with AHSA1/START domain